MNKPALPRLGAACGAIFAIVLTIAAGNGSQSFNGARAVAGVAAITVALPFIAYLCGVLRRAEGPDGWLATAAFATGITGIVLKLASGVPELAIARTHLAAGTQLNQAFGAIGDGLTVLSLYPLALFCAATAIIAFRTRALPRWLAAGAAISAVALVVNGAILGAEAVPALLVFLLWTVLTSVYLLRQSWRRPAPATTRTESVARV